MKYVAYYRVSTKKQSRSGLGLEAQKQMVQTFASANGQLIAEYVEVESGRKDQRAELTKAMALAKKADASLLIAKLDRFSRRVSFISSMMEKGVPLVIAEMPNATDFQLHIFAALAQEERRLISERTKAALAQAKRQGKKLGINGLVLAEENKKLAEEFAKRLLPYLEYDWKDQNLSEIARRLNAKGIKTRTGGNFYPQTIKNYLWFWERTENLPSASGNPSVE
jgi:DNA invertase Pin-like site-specific DNA recombinase